MLEIYKCDVLVRDEVVQKVMMSLEMTDKVMERISHPSREPAPY